MKRRILVTAVSAVTMVLLGAAAALACTATVYISVSPNSGVPGASAELFARDMPENGTARITWERADGSERQTLFEVRGQERFRRPMTVPENATQGSYYITVTGYRDGQQVGQRSVSFTVERSQQAGSGGGDPQFGPQGSTGSEPQGSTGSEPQGSTGSDPQGSSASGQPQGSSGSAAQGSSGGQPQGSSGSAAQGSSASDPQASSGVAPRDGQQPQGGSSGTQMPRSGVASQPAGDQGRQQAGAQPSSPSAQPDSSGQQSPAPQPTSQAQQPGSGQASNSASTATQPGDTDTQPGAATGEAASEGQSAPAGEELALANDAAERRQDDAQPGEQAGGGQASGHPTDAPGLTTPDGAARGDLWSGLESSETRRGLSGPSSALDQGPDQQLLTVGAGVLGIGLVLLLGGAAAMVATRRRTVLAERDA